MKWGLRDVGHCYSPFVAISPPSPLNGTLRPKLGHFATKNCLKNDIVSKVNFAAIVNPICNDFWFQANRYLPQAGCWRRTLFPRPVTKYGKKETKLWKHIDCCSKKDLAHLEPTTSRIFSWSECGTSSPDPISGSQNWYPEARLWSKLKRPEIIARKPFFGLDPIFAFGSRQGKAKYAKTHWFFAIALQKLIPLSQL